MRTQIDKSFHWGFFLSEQKLRRLVDLAQNHMEKASPSGVTRTLEVHLRDGSIVETGELEDVLGLENYGSKAIVSLDFDLKGEGDDPPSISFALQEPTFTFLLDQGSVDYSVRGSSRDWAVIAASAIEERLRKVKRVCWRRVSSKENWPLALLGVVILSLVLTPWTDLKQGPQRFDSPAALEQQRREGRIRDGADAIIQLERLKASHSSSEAMGPAIFVVIMGSLLVLLLAARFLVVGLVPRYAFY